VTRFLMIDCSEIYVDGLMRLVSAGQFRNVRRVFFNAEESNAVSVRYASAVMQQCPKLENVFIVSDTVCACVCLCVCVCVCVNSKLSV